MHEHRRSEIHAGQPLRLRRRHERILQRPDVQAGKVFLTLVLLEGIARNLAQPTGNQSGKDGRGYDNGGEIRGKARMPFRKSDRRQPRSVQYLVISNRPSYALQCATLKHHPHKTPLIHLTWSPNLMDHEHVYSCWDRDGDIVEAFTSEIFRCNNPNGNKIYLCLGTY